jgi:putative ABC transport system permease protein
MKPTTGRRGNFARGLVLSLQLLAAHRLRTVLSVSGLLIGVAAVMVMAAIGRGAEQQLRARLQAMGTDLLVISAAPAPRVAGRPRQVNVQTDLSADDAVTLLEEIPAAAASAPAVNRSAVLRWEGLNRATGLSGTTAEGLRIRNIRARAGRLFDDTDDREQQRVAVLGPSVARSLFAGVDPVGRITRIGALEFEVIGVAAPRGLDPLGNDLDDFVAIPFQTAARRVHKLNYVDQIYVQARSSDALDELERDVRGVLSAHLADRTGVTDAYTIQNQAMLLRAERAATGALNQLVPVVSGIALMLGAIGILTVMLMSVRERTREVGLRRALGASRRNIRTQFVLESGMLGIAGGAAGALVGAAASAIASYFGGWPLVIAWDAAAIGAMCSFALGLIIGIVPAARAARLEPIAALRTA